MKRVMETCGLKLLPGTNEVWSLAPGSQYTYKFAGLSLSDTYGILWSRYEKFSAALSVLQESASWVLKQLNTLDLKLFPEVKVNNRLVEFKDVIFDFQTSQVLPKNLFTTRYGDSTCLHFCDCLYDDLAKPKELLKTLHKTIRPITDFPIFLAYFGALFRNPSIFQKALYIFGAPGTSKSSLTYRVLSHVYGDAYIGQVESVKSTFQFADIVGKELVMLNDFNPEESNLALLQQLLEGARVLVQRKNKEAVKVSCTKFIFSSNEPLGAKHIYDVASQAVLVQHPFEAMDRRVLKVQFVDASAMTEPEATRATFAATLASESLALSIFCSFHARIAEFRQICPSEEKEKATPESMGMCAPASWDLGPMFDPDNTPSTKVAYFEQDREGIYRRYNYDPIARKRAWDERHGYEDTSDTQQPELPGCSYNLNDPKFYWSGL